MVIGMLSLLVLYFCWSLLKPVARISKWRRQKDDKLETKVWGEDARCKLREKSKQTNEESVIGKEWEAAGEEKECTEWKQGEEKKKFEWKSSQNGWKKARAEQIRVEKHPEWVEAGRDLNKFEWKSIQNGWKQGEI
ncbi:hypothetical protein AVEN_67708-1 [Araneus ventricosus]|uniref:Uncharacterized protein n=1 Tax=Araneus ventricosus TaxID=182803 RepID=A0A4Y2I5P7_ARAVE|nr:hypothetical protein AVEN_67708-1 [Araneus ventricosus]